MKKSAFMRAALLVLLITTHDSLIAQAVKYKASHLGTGSVENGKMQFPLQKDKDISELIVFNFTKDAIDIYSSKQQHFDLIHYSQKDDSNPSFTTYGFDAIDDDGDKVTIALVVFKGQKYYDQLYIRYGAFFFVYNINKQDSP